MSLDRKTILGIMARAGMGGGGGERFDWYVDSLGGNNASAGTSRGAALQTLAALVAKTIAAGQKVGHRRGSTWRETLTLPSSGTAADPIAYKPYNSGATPIIGGADVLSSGWSQTTITASTWTAAGQQGGVPGDGNGAAADWRFWVKAANISTSGTQIRVGMRGHSTTGNTINNASIGARNGTTDDYAAAPTRITFGSGNNSTALGANALVWSDWINFTLDEATNYLIHIEMTGVRREWFSAANSLMYYGWGGGNAMNQTWTSDGTMTNMICAEEIQVRYTPGTIWQKAATTEPKQVFFNGTLGTKVASAALCNSANKWYWTANVLYVYSTSDPATAFTNPGVEASQRSYCIDFNGGAPTWPGNYVTIDGLSVVKSNLYGIRIDASDHTMSGCKAQNCLARDNYDVGIFSWVSTSISGQIQILNNECSYNGIQAQIDGTTAAPTGIEILGSDATLGTLVEGNNVHHNAWGMELDQGSENTTIRYNNFHDNIFIGLNIDNSDNNAVYYNLLANNGSSWQFRLWDAPHATVTGNEFYNNTLYGGQAGILVEDTQSGTKIKNNIVYNPTGLCLTVDAAAAASLSANDIDYNCYWKVGADPQMWSYNGVTYTKSQFAAYQAASGQDAHSIVADPLFVSASDYHLQAGSPCDGAGVHVVLTQDYSGAAVANPPSIGAYE
jgi:parallel beta-helix repeat protein